MGMYDIFKKFDESEDKVKGGIIAIVIVIVLAHNIFDMLFPLPSQDMIAEAKEISVEFKTYEKNINDYIKKYKNLSTKEPLVKSKFIQDIHKINVRTINKKKLKQDIVKNVLKDKIRDHEEENKKLIEKYYEIDDEDAIKKLYKDIELFFMVIQKPKDVDEYLEKQISFSKNTYDNLKEYYTKLNNPFGRKKLEFINISISTIDSEFLNYNTKSKNKRYDEAYSSAKTIIDLYKKFFELNNWEIKILKDMDMKFFIQIGRSTWDSTSDFGEQNYLYKYREVSRKNFDLADKKTYVVVHNIKLDQYKDNPRGHDSREFWLNDKIIKYYHKYNYIAGSSIKEKNPRIYNTKNWIEVSSDDYWNNHSSLGKEIYSKSFGYFKNEASKKSLPIAGGFVDNIYYGDWENNIWKWKAKIDKTMTYFTNKYYTKDEYKKWNETNSSSQTAPLTNRSNSNFFGAVYYASHGNYWQDDYRRYERKRTVRGTSSSHNSRGISGGK